MHAWLTKRVCEAAQNGPTKERLLKACASADATHREGRVYFEASGAHPIDYCGHYLLYGSEYAVAILRSISCFPDYAQLLKQQGRPTLLTCDVPIEWLSERVLEELAASLVSVYYKKKLDPEYVHPRRGEGFGFAIYRDLPSSLIVKISHPEFIRDPIALA
jgi:hypothetical protein